MSNENESFLSQPPKNILLPYILLVLSHVPIHGYEIYQKLSSYGLQALDKGNVYRLLRNMEKEELVHSTWDTSGAGPAKRLYSITGTGRDYLKRHARQLENYQSLLDQFFKMYTSMLEIYFPSFEEEEKDSKNKDKDKS